MTRLLAALCLLILAVLPAFAQDSEEADRSYFLSFVENQLSSPNRQIRITGIQGALSSNATIGSITVADRQGVWLAITNARIVWTRSALLLGRLDIDTLAADQIEVIRRPLPAEGLPAPEASGFKLPELPLSITLGRLDVPRVTFGESVFGLGSAIDVDGRLSLSGGSLDTELAITRLDGPGGTLKLAATYANDTQLLDLDLKLDEPANGIVANLLAIEGRPPVVLSLDGSGPLSDLDLALTLDAAGQRVLTGTTQRCVARPTATASTASSPGPSPASSRPSSALSSAPRPSLPQPACSRTPAGCASTGWTSTPPRSPFPPRWRPRRTTFSSACR